MNILFSMEIKNLKSIEKEICKVLSAEKSLHLPPINQGAKVTPITQL